MRIPKANKAKPLRARNTTITILVSVLIAALAGFNAIPEATRPEWMIGAITFLNVLLAVTNKTKR